MLGEVSDPTTRLPLRMAPMVFVGTVIAHLTGASVGREGTAVQVAVPLSDGLTRFGRWNKADRRVLLSAAIAGGFASVFGTPLGGMVFGLEVRRFGSIRYDALHACLVAAVGGDAVTDAWGVRHATYAIGGVPDLWFWPAVSAVATGIASGVVAMSFVRVTHGLARQATSVAPSAPLRAAIGGVTVAVVFAAASLDRHMGLSLPLIDEAFHGLVSPWDFANKLALTAMCVGIGFRGGEVTPIFAMGATLGNSLSAVLPLPAPLLAAMGFVATFAGASNTPLASIVVQIELLGAPAAPYLAIACIVAYLTSGHTGMYPGQMVDQPKHERRS
jgi:H+/Cl- antiporter ClcA